MDKVATLTHNERNQLFRETAVRRGMNEAVVEKDFWVCWVLKKIFSDPNLQKHIVFKGGTSLSKVFGLIERFSEDIDLILDWGLLGYGQGQQDPYEDQPSNTQQHRFNAEFNEKAVEYIAKTLCPQITRLLSAPAGVKVSIDPKDGEIVNVAYPAAFSLAYLRPEVRLEIGPLASFAPRDSHMIQAYAAQEFPDLFDAADCPVVAIAAERTFWEKATILHQQAHRTSPVPPRFARHYYDTYRLAGSPVKDTALSDLDLLADVVAFKSRFYRSTWARYEDAKPGTFRLIPDAARLAELVRDYRQMELMIFGDRPTFDEIITRLRGLEDEINSIRIFNA